MKRFSLKILFHLLGIGSASGIFYKDHTVFIVSDNGGYLYQYDTKSQQLDKTALISGDVLENIPKKIKPDFEAMAERDGKLYIFGSGSTPNRNRMIVFDRKTKAVSTQVDLSGLYAKMRELARISPEDFNVEGATHDRKNWYFFQRGNGASGRNGIFTITGNFQTPTKITFTEIELPKINNVPVSFTDATVSGGKIWFLGSAEDTKSTYEDGAVAGSIVGEIDIKTMKIVYSEQITSEHKFEGITFYKAAKGSMSFLLCEDNDSDLLESGIFELRIGI